MHLSALESLYATFRNKKNDPDSIDDDEITRVQSELEGNDIVALRPESSVVFSNYLRSEILSVSCRTGALLFHLRFVKAPLFLYTYPMTIKNEAQKYVLSLAPGNKNLKRLVDSVDWSNAELLDRQGSEAEAVYAATGPGGVGMFAEIYSVIDNDPGSVDDAELSQVQSKLEGIDIAHTIKVIIGRGFEA